METFTAPKPLVSNPSYREQRRRYLTEINYNKLDEPIAELIGNLTNFPFCFTLQSCFGHFIYTGQQDPYCIKPLPRMGKIATVEYKIAYIALCVENSELGRNLLTEIRQIQKIDPEYIQFGCAEWFWENNVNSYALQVEPARYKDKDKVTVEYIEALQIEKVRNKFFDHLTKMSQNISKL